MNKNKLWIIGLVVVLIGSLINGLLVQNEVGGFSREFMRFVILVGIGTFVFGIIKRSKKDG